MAPESAANRKDVIAKLDPQWTAGKSAGFEVVAVTCRALDFIVLVRLGEEELGYASEGEISYRLVRADSQSAKTSP